MKLSELRPAAGSRKKTKRIGRGVGSGHGKTSCRGNVCVVSMNSYMVV